MQQTSSDKIRHGKERKNVAQGELDRWRKKLAPARNNLALPASVAEMPHLGGAVAEMSHSGSSETPDISASRRIMLAQAPAAIRRLVKIVGDDNARAVDQIQAAKAILDRAGLNIPKATHAVIDAKDLSAMGASELRSFVEAAQRALSDRAKVIDSAPAPGAKDAQATDNADDLTA